MAITFPRKGKAAIWLLLLLTAAVLLRFSVRSQPVVHGNLSPQDVSELLREVKHDIWRTAFPDSSWSTLKRLPRALWAVATARIYDVSQTFDGWAQVNGHFHLDADIQGPGFLISDFGADYWRFKKGPGGWTLRSRGRPPPPMLPWAGARPKFDEGRSFSGALSNATGQFINGRSGPGEGSISLKGSPF